MTEQTPPEYTLDQLAGAPARKRSRWPWITAAAVAFAAVVGLVIWVTLPSLADTAAGRCQDLIAERLKAPSTAQWSDSEVEDRGNGHFLVSGKVDAENSFGAAIRNSYECELYTSNGGDTWATNAVRLG